MQLFGAKQSVYWKTLPVFEVIAFLVPRLETPDFQKPADVSAGKLAFLPDAL